MEVTYFWTRDEHGEGQRDEIYQNLIGNKNNASVKMEVFFALVSVGNTFKTHPLG
jgi:hypothetical protein